MQNLGILNCQSRQLCRENLTSTMSAAVPCLLALPSIWRNLFVFSGSKPATICEGQASVNVTIKHINRPLSVRGRWVSMWLSSTLTDHYLWGASKCQCDYQAHQQTNICEGQVSVNVTIKYIDILSWGVRCISCVRCSDHHSELPKEPSLYWSWPWQYHMK
jgi:hypothetical protein